MANGVDDGEFLLPLTDVSNQRHGPVIEADLNVIRLELGASLQCLTDGLLDRRRRSRLWLDRDEIVHPPDTRQMPNRVFGIFTLVPDIDVSLQGHPAF